MTAFTARFRHTVDARPASTHSMSSWRRSADDVRTDQRVTAVVGLGSALIGIAVAMAGHGTTVAVWVGLVTLCVTPGCAIACWHSTRDRLTRVLVVLAVSVTWTILVATLFAWLQITSLGASLTATAGVGGIGSAIFLLGQLSRHRDDSPDPIPMDRHANGPAWTGAEAYPNQRFGPDPSFRPKSRQSQAPQISQASKAVMIIGLVAAAGLFAISVIRARGHNVGSYGLLPLLGILFLAATVLTVAVLVLALRFIRTAWPAAVAALCLLLVEFNATPMILDPTPLSDWTYKHFGVVDYLVHGGALNDPFDIYQQWPGFFASAAELVRVSGRSSLGHANWAQLFFEALDALVLFAIARRLVPQNRVVPYITVLLFITANWEGQFYFSPQSTAFLLALMFQFFLLSLLEPERLRRPFRNWSWLRIPPLDIQGAKQITAVGKTAQVIGIAALFGAIVVTHQLSPYMVFAGLVCLWILGVLRQPTIVLIVAAMALCYPLLHSAAVHQNFVLNGLSFSNATGTRGLTPPSQQQAIASVLAKAIALGLWGATGICILSYRRRLGAVVVPVVLAIVPLSFVLVSSYDGEGIYRVFLFSSPWCALIIAKRLAELGRIPVALRLSVVGFWALFAALGSAQAQDFGMYPMLQVPQGEISADAYFLDHAPPKAMLILAAANFPSRLNGKYVLHNTEQSQNDLSLDEITAFARNGLKNTSPASLARSIVNLAGGPGYLAVAPSMESYNQYYGVFAPGTLSTLIARLKASAYWRVWYENDGTYIFQPIPQGRSVGKEAHSHHRQMKRSG